MTRVWSGLFAVLLTVAVGCGGDDDDDDDDVIDPGVLDGACPLDEAVGNFDVALRDGFSSAQGQVFDSVTPFRAADTVDSDGACRLMRPPTLFCDPACEQGFTCAATGQCVPQPAALSVGTVTIDGLKSAVEMTAGPPVFFYTNSGTLEHPVFDEGDPIVLRATGEGAIEPFELGGVGITALALDGPTVPLETGMTTVAAWAVPGAASESEIFAVLNITQHGGTPGWIECTVDDDGELALPQSLTDQLLSSGFSGFPTLSVQRRTADSVTTSAGCVDLTVSSTQVFDVEIPGLTSCSDHDDCTPPEMCQGDLTCG